MTGVLWLFHRYRKVDKLNRGFRRGQLVSAAAFSLGHGGNDAQKTMGVILTVLIANGVLSSGSGVPALGGAVGAPGDRAGHAVRWVADRAHDGVEDHETPAGRRHGCRVRRRDLARARDASAASPCRRPTRSRARSSASARPASVGRALGRRGPRRVGLGADIPGAFIVAYVVLPAVQGDPMSMIAGARWFFLVIAVTMLLLSTRRRRSSDG